MVDVLATSAEEGRGTLREAPMRCVQPQESEMSEWGNPAGVMPCYPQGREPGELKHLSSRRKRDDSVSSGERKPKSPNQLLR
jgi:hypothetical protein